MSGKGKRRRAAGLSCRPRHERKWTATFNQHLRTIYGTSLSDALADLRHQRRVLDAMFCTSQPETRP